MILILLVLLIGAFISQSIYWLNYSKYPTEYVEFVNDKDLTQKELDVLNKKHNDYFQDCVCHYKSCTKVSYVIKKGTFPFITKEYSKDSIFYPIMTK